MAKQVTVFLDRERIYYDRDSKQEIKVGPGETVLPATVATNWGLKPYHSPTTQPWQGYDDLTVEQITERLVTLDDDEREAVRVYEGANKQRAGVLNALKPQGDEGNE